MGRTHRRPRRADHVRPEARVLGLRARPRPDAPARRRRATSRRGQDLRPGGDLQPAGARRRGGGAGRARSRRPTRSAPRSCQRDRHAAFLAAHRRHRRLDRALRDRGAQPPAHRDRRAPGAVPRAARRARARCPTSATRSSPSASSAWPACCAATPSPGWRTRRCGTSGTSATRRSSGSRCPARPALLALHAGPLPGLVDDLVVRPERMRENLERGLGLHASEPRS